MSREELSSFLKQIFVIFFVDNVHFLFGNYIFFFSSKLKMKIAIAKNYLVSLSGLYKARGQPTSLPKNVFFF